MSHWWSSKPELILVQIWVVLILAHIVYALRERIALAANCDPFEVSIPILVDLLSQHCNRSTLRLEQFVQTGHQCGLLRASPRLELSIPKREISCYQPAPPDLPRQRPGRAPSPPRTCPPKPIKRACGYEVQRQRRQASKEAKTMRAIQAKVPRIAQPSTGAT